MQISNIYISKLSKLYAQYVINVYNIEIYFFSACFFIHSHSRLVALFLYLVFVVIVCLLSVRYVLLGASCVNVCAAMWS